MRDGQQNELLEKFINDSSLATAIKITVTTHHKSFKPKLPGLTANYEECNMLAGILLGAENFCYWLRRNNYELIKTKKLPKDWGKVKVNNKLQTFGKKFEGLKRGKEIE